MLSLENPIWLKSRLLELNLLFFCVLILSEVGALSQTACGLAACPVTFIAA